MFLTDPSRIMNPPSCFFYLFQRAWGEPRENLTVIQISNKRHTDNLGTHITNVLCCNTNNTQAGLQAKNSFQVRRGGPHGYSEPPSFLGFTEVTAFDNPVVHKEFGNPP